MLFNSLIFLFCFFPAVLFLYCLCDFKLSSGGINSGKRQTILNGILLGFSLVFYAWDNLDHVSVLLSLILINYLIGFSKNECRPVLLLGIGYNLWVLFQYKYLSAILSALQAGDSAGVLAPLGISFLIFHAISYLMDLYQGRCEPEKNLLSFALYLAFFPKVAQGPIVKYYEMREQLRFRPVVTVDRISDGLVRFIIGLGKKVLLADLLGETVTEIFGLTSYWGMDVPTAWIGCLAYTMQIYLDFSGYSDMAIGLSRTFGFRVEENFRFPYLSRSITEFWRRWHISLGSWFREYLYIPLGGNRRGNVYFNLFFVFFGNWNLARGRNPVCSLGNWTRPLCGNRAEGQEYIILSENSECTKMGGDDAAGQHRMADLPPAGSGSDDSVSWVHVRKWGTGCGRISPFYLAVLPASAVFVPADSICGGCLFSGATGSPY